MDNEVLELLKKTNALITGSHIVGTSGRHMSVYINKDALYPHPKDVSRIGYLFAEKNKHLDIDIVAAPALGGIILSTWVAYYLSELKGKEILGIYAEKTPDNTLLLRRGYDTLVKGKNVLIVEDVTTTGGSVKQILKTVRNAGGDVVNICVMVNRDPEKLTSTSMDAPFSYLAVIKADSWDENECPLCKNNVPINTTIGHGTHLHYER